MTPNALQRLKEITDALRSAKHNGKGMTHDETSELYRVAVAAERAMESEQQAEEVTR